MTPKKKKVPKKRGGKGMGIKGKGYERELVKKAASKEIVAERTWGSNGASRGLHKEVDLIFLEDQYEWETPLYFQTKRPKSVPEYLLLDPGELKIITSKTGDQYFVLSFVDFMKLYRTSGGFCFDKVIDISRTIGQTFRPGPPEIFGQIFRANHDKRDILVVRASDWPF